MNTQGIRDAASLYSTRPCKHFYKLDVAYATVAGTLDDDGESNANAVCATILSDTNVVTLHTAPTLDNSIYLPSANEDILFCWGAAAGKIYLYGSTASKSIEIKNTANGGINVLGYSIANPDAENGGADILATATTGVNFALVQPNIGRLRIWHSENKESPALTFDSDNNYSAASGSISGSVDTVVGFGVSPTTIDFSTLRGFLVAVFNNDETPSDIQLQRDMGYISRNWGTGSTSRIAPDGWQAAK